MPLPVFNFLDLLFLIVIGLAAFHGARRGVLTGVASLVIKILAIGVAIFFHTRLLDALDPIWHLREKLSPLIETLVRQVLGQTAPSLPAVSSTNATDLLIAQLTAMMTTYALKVVAFIIIVFLVYTICSLIISFVITPLAKVLGPLDRIGGLLFCGFSAFIVLALLCGLIEPFLEASSAYHETIRASLSYPLLKSGYYLISSTITAFVGDSLQNPFDAIPSLDLFAI